MVQCSNQFVECRIAEWLWKFVPLTLLIIGTGGNIVNIIVLSRPKLRRYSTSVYLVVLAVSDTMGLWAGVPKFRYIYLFDRDFLSLSYLHCTFVSWMGISSAAMSTWTVVNLTIERVLLTMYPIKAKLRLTPKVSILVSMTTVLVIQVFTAHLLFARTFLAANKESLRNLSSCEISSEEYNRFYKTAWSSIVLVFLNLIPIAIIITGNALIGTRLLKRKQQIYPKLNTNQINLAREKKALKMLFAISLLYIICTSPHWIYTVVRTKSTPRLSAKEKAVDQLVRAILYVLLFSNLTFNFVLYFARGSLFREECNEILKSFKLRFLKSNQRRGMSNEARTIRTITTDNQIITS